MIYLDIVFKNAIISLLITILYTSRAEISCVLKIINSRKQNTIVD